MAPPCRAFGLTRIVGQLILSSSELAWPRQRAADMQGTSGGHVSLGRIKWACTALSLSERLAELTLLQPVWYKSPFTSTLTEHDGAYPITADIYFGHAVYYLACPLLSLLGAHVIIWLEKPKGSAPIYRTKDKMSIQATCWRRACEAERGLQTMRRDKRNPGAEANRREKGLTSLFVGI